VSDHAAVAAALAESVADVGRLATTDPFRVRALLSDTLGAGARANRAEIDAVVMAVEEGVPAALIGRRRGPGGATDVELLSRLEARGLDPAMSQFALGAWGAAMAAETSVPNPLTEPVPTDSTPDGIRAGQLVGHPRSEPPRESLAQTPGQPPVGEDAAPPSVDTPVTEETARPGDDTSSAAKAASTAGRRGLLIGGAAVAALALVAGTAYAVTQRGAQGPDVNALTTPSVTATQSSTPSASPVSTSASAVPARTPSPPDSAALLPASTTMTSPSNVYGSLDPRGKPCSATAAGHRGVLYWCGITLTPVNTGTGAYDVVEAYPESNPDNTPKTGLGYVQVAKNKSGRLVIYFSPSRNGQYRETVHYRLKNTWLGVVSRWATITVTVKHNPNVT